MTAFRCPAAFLLGLLLLGAGCSGEQAPAAGEGAAYFTVRRGTVRVRLSYRGTVEAGRYWKLSPEVDRQVKLTYLADEGASVAKGDVLARYDVPGLEDEIGRVEQKLSEAVHRLRNVEVELAIDRKVLALEEEEARRRLAEAEAERAQFVDRKRDLEAWKDRVAVEEALERKNRAERDLAELPGRLAEGFATRDDLLAARNRYRSAEQAHYRAVSEQRMGEAYDRPVRLARLEADEARARQRYEAAQRLGAVRLQGRRLERFHHAERVRLLTERWKKLRSLREDRELRAPVDGVVVYGDPEQRRRRRRHLGRDDEVAVGATVWGESVVVTLPSMAEPVVLIEVPEDKVYLLRPGAEARLRCSDGVERQGTVASVAELATEAGRRADLSEQTFSVAVSAAGGKGLEPHRTVDVSMDVAVLEDVMHVPLHALFRERGRDYCRRWNGAELERAEVEVGRRGRHYAEIRSGLDEGDRVFLGLPRAGGEAVLGGEAP